VLETLPNVGIARIRMPIDVYPGPANLIDKLKSYPKIVDVKNSVTIVPDMIEVFYKLLVGKHSGIYHVINPGEISHKEILQSYKLFVKPNHKNEWITAEELVSSGLAKKIRSNNILNSDSLRAIGIEMREVHDAIEDTMIKYANFLKI